MHATGEWHRTVHCWIVRRLNGGGGGLLFQQRHAAKETWPGKLDTTAAGHLTAGEVGVFRELEEELGVRPSPREIYHLGERRYQDRSSPGIIDREFQSVCIWFNRLALDGYRLQESEVSGLVEVEIDAYAALRRGLTAQLAVTRSSPDGAVRPGSVTRADFVPEVDGASLLVAAAARSLLADPTVEVAVPGWGPAGWLDRTPE